MNFGLVLRRPIETAAVTRQVNSPLLSEVTALHRLATVRLYLTGPELTAIPFLASCLLKFDKFGRRQNIHETSKDSFRAVRNSPRRLIAVFGNHRAGGTTSHLP